MTVLVSEVSELTAEDVNREPKATPASWVVASWHFVHQEQFPLAIISSTLHFLPGHVALLMPTLHDDVTAL